MAVFEQLNNQLVVNSKLSLIPHWIHLNLNFSDYKKSWSKNLPPGCNLGQPQYGRLPKKRNDDLAVQYEDCPWLGKLETYNP